MDATLAPILSLELEWKKVIPKVNQMIENITEVCVQAVVDTEMRLTMIMKVILDIEMAAGLFDIQKALGIQPVNTLANASGLPVKLVLRILDQQTMILVITILLAPAGYQ